MQNYFNTHIKIKYFILKKHQQAVIISFNEENLHAAFKLHD